ncbi:hypothetical protein KCG44_05515 [Pacificimonas sp. WHA3]|uniref:Uncharacterized protein n=1 Tax=Pacificimonas pallii TaxID=2827236 RepID=A0ABS6SD12_9SPHN|nr:hypothetical protein [Pacificimonas pallii]MBV7256240.1 hypothetical protein [Pacificimonas pallii]
MFNEPANTNILRSLVGMIAATALTVTVFYGAAGPDPRADVYTASPMTAVAANTAGLSLA